MKFNTQDTLKAALILTMLAMLTACGAQAVDQNNDFSSRAPVDNNSSSAKPPMYCNEKTQSGLTAKMMIYTDSAHKIRNDLMRLKLTQVPASFISGDYIQMYRWQANTANQVYLDPTPVQARFETLDGKVLTEFSPYIAWRQVAEIAKASGMSDPNTFLKYVRLVVDIRDPQAQFDVLKIAFYNSNNQAIVDMDILMPAIFGSPVDYAYEGSSPRAPILQALHPFASMKGQNLTSAQFVSMGDKFCF